MRDLIILKLLTLKRLLLICFAGLVLIFFGWYVTRCKLWDYFSSEARLKRRKEQIHKQFKNIRILATEIDVDASQQLTVNEKYELSKKLNNIDFERKYLELLPKINETLSLVNVTTRPLREVSLWMHPLHVDKVFMTNKTGAEFLPVPFRYDFQDSSLYCKVRKPLNPHEEVKVRIIYVSSSELKNGLWYLSPYNYQVDQFLPQKVSVIEKDGEVAVSSGKLVEIKKDTIARTVTFKWEAKHGLGLNLYSDNFIALNKQRQDGVNICLYVPKPSDSIQINLLSKYGFATLNKYDSIYTILTRCFGDLRTPDDSTTFSKLGIIVNRNDQRPYACTSIINIPEHLFWSSLSNYKMKGNTEITAHEAAHQWWGNTVRSKRKGAGSFFRVDEDIWLVEGGAIYGDLMVKEKMSKHDSFINFMNCELENINERASIATPDPPRNVSKIKNVFDDREWAYGIAFMLRTLSHLVGEDAFYRTIQDLINQYRYKWIDEEEFAEFVKKENPGVDLAWFFPLFFKTGDYARVDYALKDVTVDSIQSDRYRVHFVINDLGLIKGIRKTGILPIHLSVLVKYNDSKNRLFINDIVLDSTGQKEINCDVSSRPDSILLDPDMWFIGVDWDYTNNHFSFTDAKLEKGFIESIKGNPNVAKYHLDYGKYLSKHQNYQEAEREYREATRLIPNSPEAHCLLSGVLGDQKIYIAMESEAREALSLKTNYVEAHINLGIALHNQKRYQEAEKEYREAIRLEPELFQSHWNLGVLLSEEGKRQEGEREIQRAFSLKGKH